MQGMVDNPSPLLIDLLRMGWRTPHAVWDVAARGRVLLGGAVVVGGRLPMIGGKI